MLQPTPELHVDVVIVGAGPAGLAAAHTVAHFGDNRVDTEIASSSLSHAHSRGPVFVPKEISV
jgi:flavin-dependent dehydrogenase